MHRSSVRIYMLLSALAGVMLLASVPVSASGPSHRVAIKDASSLSYLLIHPLHRVEAVSKDITCAIDYDDATHTVIRADFSADVTTFDSGNSNRDSHAMEVLDALSYPNVSYQSTRIETASAGLLVHGNLTFHGQTHPVDVHASTVQAGDRLTINGNSAVSLTAFGIERPSLLMMPTEDTLRISFTMVFPTAAQ